MIMWRTQLRDCRTPFSATPFPADSVRLWRLLVWLCDEHNCVIDGHYLQPHPPQPIRSSPPATRSSLARARKPASGVLARRAPPGSLSILRSRPVRAVRQSGVS